MKFSFDTNFELGKCEEKDGAMILCLTHYNKDTELVIAVLIILPSSDADKVIFSLQDFDSQGNKIHESMGIVSKLNLVKSIDDKKLIANLCCQIVEDEKLNSAGIIIIVTHEQYFSLCKYLCDKDIAVQSIYTENEMNSSSVITDMSRDMIENIVKDILNPTLKDIVRQINEQLSNVMTVDKFESAAKDVLKSSMEATIQDVVRQINEQIDVMFKEKDRQIEVLNNEVLLLKEQVGDLSRYVNVQAGDKFGDSNTKHSLTPETLQSQASETHNENSVDRREPHSKQSDEIMQTRTNAKIIISEHHDSTIQSQTLVEPEEIIKALEYLATQRSRYNGSNSAKRNFALFYFNINNGLRVQDLLELRISDVMHDGSIKENAFIFEARGGKKKELFLGGRVKEILYDYIISMEGWDYNWYLFPANSIVSKTPDPYKPMTRENLFLILRNIKKELGFDFTLNSSSTRKIYKRAMYDNGFKQTVLGYSSTLANHSSNSEQVQKDSNSWYPITQQDDRDDRRNLHPAQYKAEKITSPNIKENVDDAKMHYVDLNKAEDLSRTFPLYLEYFGERTDSFNGWQHLYGVVMQYLLEDYPDTIRGLKGKGICEKERVEVCGFDDYLKLKTAKK